MATLGEEVTGLMATVGSLQDSCSWLTQQLLLRPDINTFTQYKKSWNSEIQSTTSKVDEFNSELNQFESMLINLSLDFVSLSGYLYDSITGGSFGGNDSPGNYISETFETISKNLKQYPYSLYYDSNNYLTGIRYQISSLSYVTKNLTYDVSGLITQVMLTGDPVPETSLYKYLYYSNGTLTGVTYS